MNKSVIFGTIVPFFKKEGIVIDYERRGFNE